MKIRIGFGVDVHQLVSDRKLFLGGVEVPSDLGALGHSDADVLLHAICDAMLGALNLRDIGFHFSDQDLKYKNIDSKILLRDTFQLIKEKGF
jgi:2-C-methyl-D-erythritol 2,4-cyclodiphosphate synthase